MKKIFNVVKKLCLAIFLLYGLNVIISALDIMIPINIITVSVVTLLGIPGLFSLIVMVFLL